MIYVLGAFDGLHLGHQLLLEEARKAGALRKMSWGVLTFSPNPKAVLGRRSFADLFLSEERKRIAARLEVPAMEVLPFTRKLAEMEPLNFLGLLEERYSFEGLVVGEDFRFGRARMGDISMLEEQCAARKKFFKAVPSAWKDGEIISTTRIRRCVRDGCMEEAQGLLGYPYFLSGIVSPGDKRGRALGFPTANLSVSRGKLLPRPGVYGGITLVKGVPYSAAVNIGYNPTFEGVRSIRIEAHLQGYEGNLYGTNLELHLLFHLRSERKFPSPGELVVQLREDAQEIRQRMHLWSASSEGEVLLARLQRESVL
ncbi:MAG TPA: riboflavin biosynthesis protein RibF [Synergistaceae bacterium]|nr:riboflavin biosynthesis protein RibF [Synergistaceae bacterium]HPJ25240.1 riboflavin biosynthesis protein RibF [Synergistaceae bacterium]HPQ36111.1 riboflavin biosynthesis protein RibF [Synergistaceae bacterium]